MSMHNKMLHIYRHYLIENKFWNISKNDHLTVLTLWLGCHMLFLHLNSDNFKKKHTFIVCKMYAGVYGSGNHPFNYKLK